MAAKLHIAVTVLVQSVAATLVVAIVAAVAVVVISWLLCGSRGP